MQWGSKAFNNLLIVPPGSGIVHQVNLEYLSRTVFAEKDGVLYPDSVVGTDSHTTMIDGSGVLGWGVGGIEAEAVMLGQPISMVIPEVVGYELVGKMGDVVTSTDLVLTITKVLLCFIFTTFFRIFVISVLLENSWNSLEKELLHCLLLIVQPLLTCAPNMEPLSVSSLLTKGPWSKIEQFLF